MIEIEKTLVSRDLVEKRFVCDLNACKGACCVKGDSGAPLEEEEIKIIETIYEKIKPYMRPEGIDVISKHGFFQIDAEGDIGTTLVEGKECAYAFFDEKGVAWCAFEKAWLDKKTEFKKPVSCHLFPIRIKKYKYYEAVNFNDWDVCRPACKCGSELNVKVYRFLKEALVRKYGEEWYKQLEAADEYLSLGQNDK
jgi:hypothetical protein